MNRLNQAWHPQVNSYSLGVLSVCGIERVIFDSQAMDYIKHKKKNYNLLEKYFKKPNENHFYRVYFNGKKQNKETKQIKTGLVFTKSNQTLFLHAKPDH